MKIYCCGCSRKVAARLTTGKELYPRRDDLHAFHFWICDTCKNFVGTHHKADKNKDKPLGCIPTPELKNARKHIHRILDPLWKRGHFHRSKLYAMIAKRIKRKKFHTAEIRTVPEARIIYKVIKQIKSEVQQ